MQEELQHKQLLNFKLCMDLAIPKRINIDGSNYTNFRVQDNGKVFVDGNVYSEKPAMLPTFSGENNKDNEMCNDENIIDVI